MAAKKNKDTADAREILYKLLVEGKPEMEALLEEERTKIRVLRTETKRNRIIP